MLRLEDAILGLGDAMHGQPLCIRLDFRDALGDFFREEKLAGMRDMPAGVFLLGDSSHMYLGVHVNGAAKVPTGIECGKLYDAAVVANLHSAQEASGVNLT